MARWNVFFDYQMQRLQGLSRYKKYTQVLFLLDGIPYRWGREMPDGADCSGAVCLALSMALGRAVRVSADSLFRVFFTDKDPEPNQIQAVFFITDKPTSHGDRKAAAGECVHVAGIAAQNVALDCAEPYARIETLDSLVDRYEQRGLKPFLRGFNELSVNGIQGSVCLSADAGFIDLVQEGYHADIAA